MDRRPFPHNAHWYRSAESLRNLLIVVILTLALTTSLLVLAYRTTFTALLGLTHFVAIVGAVLHVAVVLLLTMRIAHAANIWKNLRSQDKQTADMRQLRQTIFNTAGMTALMLLLTVGAACTPLVMQLPELGLVFCVLLVTLVLHSANINRSASQLRDAITAAEWSAQCTMAT
ncbi:MULTISPECIES: hypothetical protein [unclassified Xanthomonas]|uniref:hypothetical protein n=1 Tax=unclassified Xanthomonas TaxID=2643310 RepID=UPI002B231AC0|nr:MULTISPECIES: hypothetical protein [unclassified Xanthomonas]MEA9563841.1 hypothetical protein [Xanthomonas sp. WHRI 8932A]MEA9634831.1 hypothetical protein [Xanthomonas sp. WHRI 8812E]